MRKTLCCLPLVAAWLVLARPFAASQDREPSRNQQMPQQDKIMDQRQLIKEKTLLDYILKKCRKQTPRAFSMPCSRMQILTQQVTLQK